MTDQTELRRAALRQQLVEQVDGSRRRTARQIGGVAGLTVVVGAGATLAFTSPWSAPVVDQGLLHCRAGASVDSTDVMAHAGTSSEDPPQQETRFGGAQQTCAALWRQGILVAGNDFPKDLPRPSAGQIPPMITCVDSDNVPVVVPGLQTSTCNALGLAAGTAN